MNDPPIEGKWYWVWRKDYKWPIAAQRGYRGWSMATYPFTRDDAEMVLQWEPIPPPTMGAPKGKEQTE